MANSRREAMTPEELQTQARIVKLVNEYLYGGIMPKYTCRKCGREYIDTALEGLVACPYCEEPIRREGVENENLPGV